MHARERSHEPDIDDTSAPGPDDGFDMVPVEPRQVYLLRLHPFQYHLPTKLATQKSDVFRLPLYMTNIKDRDVVILWQGGPQSGIYGIAKASGSSFEVCEQPEIGKCSRLRDTFNVAVTLRFVYTLTKPLLQTTLKSQKALHTRTVVGGILEKAGYKLDPTEWRAIYRLLEDERDAEIANGGAQKKVSSEPQVVSILDAQGQAEKPAQAVISLPVPETLLDKQSTAILKAVEWQGAVNPFASTVLDAATERLAMRLVENPHHQESSDVYRLVKTRGKEQQVFSHTMRLIYDNQCAFCGFSLAVALEAAHIKPWTDCTSAERLLPSNGFLLCAVHHKLFDAGLIWVNNAHLVEVFAPDSLSLISKADDQLILDLHGTKVRKPKKSQHWPSPEFLEYRKSWVARLYGVRRFTQP